MVELTLLSMDAGFLAITLVKFAMRLAGFRQEGVRRHSVAAYIMSRQGSVQRGGFVARLQSVSSRGMEFPHRLLIFCLANILFFIALSVFAR
jgi:Interferon-induced 6-16 family